MKKVDILFLYETKVRELENICLLKYELERRGYSVAILNTWNELGHTGRPKYDAKVVVTHAMYHDGIYEFVRSIVGKVPKVVNMQCEQVGTIRDDESDDARFVLRGVASQCMNICWGQQTVNRLVEKSKIDLAHLCLAGQITLDFCRPELRGYYCPRQEISRMYGLPKNCELNLFISSFAYVNLPDNIVAQSEIKDKDVFIRCSQKSFDGILQWFDDLLCQRHDQVIIYRPHPAEANNSQLNTLVQKHLNRFFVIGQHSVKQWLAISDRVYTWYSSAIAEAYMFGVPCAILRPVEISRDMEIALFEKAQFITDYAGFLNSIENGINISIDPEIFAKFYDVTHAMSYIRVADAIEMVLKDDKYLIKNPPALPKKTLKLRIKETVRAGVGLVANRLPEKIHLLDRYRVPKASIDPYTLQRRENNFASNEEIREIQEKIDKLLSIRRHIL